MSINQTAINLTQQLKEVIDQLTEEQFRQPIDVLSGSSIGQHTRHTLEFFLCLMDASNGEEINYDDRRRDQYIEQDPRLATRIIDSIQNHLRSAVQDFPILMKANYEIDRDEQISISTSFLRELSYNIEHGIHHMALIKVGVKSRFTNINLPAHFGVASSTVRFQKSQNA